MPKITRPHVDRCVQTDAIQIIRSVSWLHRPHVVVVWLALGILTISPAAAQQFNSDNQWVAPHGVGTFVLSIGQEYSTFLAVAALLPETEFNIGVTHFVDKPLDVTEGHYSGILYVKRRLSENEAGTGGWAVMGGTGVYPGYLSEGEVTVTFQ